MNSTQSLEDLLKSFEDHCRKFEVALDQARVHLNQIGAKTEICETSTPYAIAAEFMLLGFYLRDRILKTGSYLEKAATLNSFETQKLDHAR